MSKAEDMLKDYGSSIDNSLGKTTPEIPVAGQPIDRSAAEEAAAKRVGQSKGNLGFIEIEHLHRDPDQPRKEFDDEEMASLEASIAKHGVLDPVSARWLPSPARKWQLIEGERRLRCCEKLKIAKIPCFFVEKHLTELEVKEDQYERDRTKAPWKPVERARVLEYVMKERGFTQQQLAAHFNLAQSTVSDALKLLDVPEGVREQIEQETTSPKSVVAKTRRKRKVAKKPAIFRADNGHDESELSAADNSAGDGRIVYKTKISTMIRGVKITVEHPDKIGDDLIWQALSDLATAYGQKTGGQGRAAAA